MTDKIHILDVVRILNNEYNDGLRIGDEGTVVDVLAPDVFEVEFSDDNGHAYAIRPFRAEQLLVVYYAGKNRRRSVGRFEVYTDTRGEFRWRLKASNGQVIATSGDGYASKTSCLNGIESVKTDAPDATVVETY
jgi:uncharacterized protein YegP (UPF0339 family)